MAECSQPVLSFVCIILFLLVMYFLYNYYIENKEGSRPKTIINMLLIPRYTRSTGYTGYTGSTGDTGSTDYD